MTTKRSPYDGEPYYCSTCGAGLVEFYHCEWPTCELESRAAAQERQQKRREAEVSPK